MAILRPLATNIYEQFRYDLEKESPRAAYWLESMIYGMMAQMDGMTEDTALELACKIVLAKSNGVISPALQKNSKSLMSQRSAMV